MPRAPGHWPVATILLPISEASQKPVGAARRALLTICRCIVFLTYTARVCRQLLILSKTSRAAAMSSTAKPTDLNTVVASALTVL